MFQRLSLRDLFSFELIFLLFLFAGVFKGADIFAHINERYDLTVTTALLGMVCGVFVLVCRQRSPASKNFLHIAIYLVFLGYVIISYFFCEYKSEEATLKLLKFSVFNTWGVVASLFLLDSRWRIERLLRLFFFLTLYLGFDALVRTQGEGLVRSVGVLGVESYQALGNLMALGVEIALVAMIFETRQKHRLLYGMVISGMIIAMMLSGARQALVGLVVVVMFLSFILCLKKNVAVQLIRHYLPMILLLPVFFVLLRTFVFNDLDTSWGSNRILQVFTNSASDSLTESSRTYIWQDAIEIWKENFTFGAGFGAFREAASSPDFRHPHNMFLEYLCELGLVGFGLGCSLWSLTLLELLNRQRLLKDPLFLTICVMFLHVLTAAQVTGDMADNRFMYVLAALVVSVPAMRLPRSISNRVRVNKRGIWRSELRGKPRVAGGAL